MIQIHIRITENLNKKLDQVKLLYGSSKSETIRRALNLYFKKED